MPLVGHIVRETMGRLPGHVNRDDLTSAGLAALVQAARSYDETRGVPFARYAATRIRGAILDELRGIDWASRSVRRRARELDDTRTQLAGDLGRVPTDAEVAEAAGVTVDEVAANDDDVSRAQVMSLQGFGDTSIDDVLPTRAPEPGGDGRAARADRLPGRRRRRCCPSGCASSSRATSSPSGRWPRSPTSSASPSPGSRRCAPRRWSCSRTP